MKKVCTFWGHRDVYLYDVEPLEEAVKRAITEFQITSFWFGGYSPFDRRAAEAIYCAKREHAHVELLYIHAYMPQKAQAIHFPFDGTIYPDGLETVPPRYAISWRNKWMVRHSDLLITKIDRPFGGAFTSQSLAERLQKPIIKLGHLR